MKTTVVDSPSIDHYKIKGKPSAALKDFREMRSYAAAASRELPPFVRLFRSDWLEIDEQVRKQSANKFNANTVFLDNLPLKRLGDA